MLEEPSNPKAGGPPIDGTSSTRSAGDALVSGPAGQGQKLSLEVSGRGWIPEDLLALVLALNRGIRRKPRKSGVERVKGIEPSSQAWEAHILPLNHTRTV